MSKNTIDSITEQEENVVTSTSLSSDVGDSLQGVTSSHSESLGVNEMSSTAPRGEEEELDELSPASQPNHGVDDVTSSMESKSQLRNFLSVAKAKWDNVPQGWMQQRTNKDDWSLLLEAPAPFLVTLPELVELRLLSVSIY